MHRTYEFSLLFRTHFFVAGLALGLLPGLEASAGKRGAKPIWPRLLLLGLPFLILGLLMVWPAWIGHIFPRFLWLYSEYTQLFAGAVVGYVLPTSFRK
ncbi:MAG: hypothetical protein FH749_10730 [Firmicutes bacterium]|nr:hypothetical protein [Bacillota bacterium]